MLFAIIGCSFLNAIIATEADLKQAIVDFNRTYNDQAPYSIFKESMNQNNALLDRFRPIKEIVHILWLMVSSMSRAS